MTNSAPKGNSSDPLELLSFWAGKQEYSVDIMLVREIRGWTRATPLPHSAPYVRGVINLRGAVLPILDLSKRLDIGTTETTERNVIIVVQNKKQTIGLLVDAVSDIVSVSASELQTPPESMSDAKSTFVKALTVIQSRMLRVLDLDAVYPENGSTQT